MRKKFISIIMIALLLLSSMAFSACKKSSDESSGSNDSSDSSDEEVYDIDELMEESGMVDDYDYDDSDLDDPAFENEIDGAEPVMQSHEEKDFYGKWSATSNRAHYLFNNVDLDIKEDGTWTGNIVEEDFEGTWEYKDASLYIKSSNGLINYNLFFVEDGSLMFKDLDDEDLAPLVLKAQ